MGSKAEKTVMILGAGVMQLPALRIAREKGWRTIVADGNFDAPGVSEADIFEPIDLKDLDGLLTRATFHKNHGGLNGVFTAGTDFSASVAYVAERLGLPGIPYETALNATDKSRMRRIFQERGVPSPKFFTLGVRDIETADLGSWEFPLVVKPVDNMGARGVERVSSVEEFREKAVKSAGFSRSRRVIVEEFIDGPEFSIDALVSGGEIFICGIADRHIYFPPYFVELGHTMPSRADKAILAELVRVFRQGVEALGIDRGAAKGDVFLSSRGPVIGEIAARLSGGYMSGWTYPYSSGVRVTEGGLNIAVGLPPGDLLPKFFRTAAERAFISLPGRVKEIRGMEEARNTPGVRDVFTRVRVGGEVKFPENNVEKCGNVISALPEADSAIVSAENATAEIFLRLETGDPRTENFLFGTSSLSRWAYPLSADLRRKLDGMTWIGERSSVSLPLSFGPFFVFRWENLSEVGKDWNHRSVEKGLDLLSRLYHGLPTPKWARRLVLGRVFWHAFFRGGIQGAAWVVDTLGAEKEPEAVLSRVAVWERLGV